MICSIVNVNCNFIPEAEEPATRGPETKWRDATKRSVVCAQAEGTPSRHLQKMANTTDKQVEVGERQRDTVTR